MRNVFTRKKSLTPDDSLLTVSPSLSPQERKVLTSERNTERPVWLPDDNELENWWGWPLTERGKSAPPANGGL